MTSKHEISHAGRLKDMVWAYRLFPRSVIRRHAGGVRPSLHSGISTRDDQQDNLRKLGRGTVGVPRWIVARGLISPNNHAEGDHKTINLLTTGLQGLHRVCLGTASRLRNLYYRSLGVRLGGYVWMRAIEIPRRWEDITLEGGVALDRGVTLVCGGDPGPNKLVIRSGTYVNRYTTFDAHLHLEVGRNCMIGPRCYITDADHGKDAGLSVQMQPMKKAPVIIEDEVWIGAGVIILPGVRIGKGAVVGAASVVTRDVPSNAIVIGAPARLLRYRE